MSTIIYDDVKRACSHAQDMSEISRRLWHERRKGMVSAGEKPNGERFVRVIIGVPEEEHPSLSLVNISYAAVVNSKDEQPGNDRIPNDSQAHDPPSHGTGGKH